MNSREHPIDTREHLFKSRDDPLSSCEDSFNSCDHPLSSGVHTFNSVTYSKAEVLKWWVAGPKILTLDSMRAPKFRH